MLSRRFTDCLIRPADVVPSHDDLEVVGTFNPGAAAVPGGEVVLLVRVAERPRRRRPGCTALPRHEPGRGLVIDQVPDEQLEPIDARVVRRRSDGCIRLTFISHLRVVRSRDGRHIDDPDAGRFLPLTANETYGVEDPRITRIGHRFWFTYVAVSPHGAATALASTTDFRRFERHGLIFCPENKDVLLFPQRIRGRHAALHRPNPATHFAAPEMWLAWSDDLLHWGGHQRLLGGGCGWSAGRIGGGCPPLPTGRGWLAIYHGNDRAAGGPHGNVGAYAAAAFLMDRDDPTRIVAHSDGPILRAEADFERRGFLPDIVFPTGLVEQEQTVLVYYGAADACTGVVGFDRDDLLAALLPCS